MKRKKLVWNTITSLLYQIVSIVCGFILPRLILKHFGSATNGLVNSITQFLGMIALLELGVGAVVTSSLYKPLAENDNIKISQIMSSANKFFKRLAYVLAVYVIILVFLYPKIAPYDYDWEYTAILIIAISISAFAQYYFGIVDRLLLIADQRGYVQYTVMLVTLLLNTVVCAVLIEHGGSIHEVKLTTSFIFLIRPVILRIYVNKNYKIDRKIKYTGEPIKQKWNGIAQQFSAVVLLSTDNIILTIFASFEAVSIYSVYYSIVSGVKLLLTSISNGMQAILGEYWAKNETEKLKEAFNATEWMFHTIIVWAYGCTIMMIVPFVSVYTNGVYDADYIQPIFAVLLSLANGAHCIRIPYNMMIMAAGHYKQTQSNYIVSAVINIIISIATVKLWGLIGVAIGTLVAMAYQSIWMAIYNSKYLVKRPISTFAKQILTDGVEIVAAVVAMKYIGYIFAGYLQWFITAAVVAIVWGVAIFTLNFLLYRKNISWLIKKYIKI